jgi:hypothetical protein
LRLIPWGCPPNRPKNDIENKHAITNYYNMIFNHEGSGHSHLFNIGKNDDLFYIRNDFEKFKERYSLRINNYRDYIKNYDQTDDIIQNYDKMMMQQNSIDSIYNDIQTPLLLVVLYFLFQLPFFRKLLYQYFPALFAKDGNINIYGLLFTSALFGLIYYILDKATYHFNVF